MKDTIFHDYDKSTSDHSDRSAQDRQRHRQKIREAMRKGIADIIADEAIINKSGDKIIKIPVKSLKEYRFAYGDDSGGSTTGNENSQPGDVIGNRHNHENGNVGQGGQGAGDDIIETDVTLDEVLDMAFEDLGLPDLERKKLRELETETVKRKGYRRVGIRVRLDAKRTIAEKIKRKLSSKRLDEDDSGSSTLEEEDFPFRKEDLRYKHMQADVDHESNAVVICIMDTSGSMDNVKKYLARMFFFLLHRFVLRKYVNVEIVFIAHTDGAKEVDEETFFHKAESGGTVISTGYKEALRIINDRYHPSLWNIYAFHCSDGENWSGDNEEAVKQLKQLVKVCQLCGYGEICPSAPMGSFYSSWYGSAEYKTMINVYADECKANPKDWEGFLGVRFSDKEHLWDAFKTFLSREKQQ